jgi:hypothetical protein
VWGASMGGNFGAQRGTQKAAEARLEQMGISREVRVAAAECARDLEEASSGLASCKEALQSAKAFEAQLESGAEQARRRRPPRRRRRLPPRALLLLSHSDPPPARPRHAPTHHQATLALVCQAYAAAQTALVGGDEAEARACLERRASLREQLTKAQGERADAFGRVTRMEAAVAMLTEHSRSIEAAMSRAVAVSAEGRHARKVRIRTSVGTATVLLRSLTCVLAYLDVLTCSLYGVLTDHRTGSSSVARGSAAPLSLEDDDPLLRRFKELERDP